MQLNELFPVTEGVSDPVIVGKADSAYDDMLQKLQSGEDLVTEYTDHSILRNELAFSTMIFPDLALVIAFTPSVNKREAGQYLEKDSRRDTPAIVIWAQNSSEVIKKKREAFKSVKWDPTSMCASVLENNYDAFTHEFVHHMDKLRRKEPEKKEPGKEKDYNDPSEMNAYFLQFFAGIKRLSKMDPEQWLNLDHAEFLRRTEDYVKRRYSDFFDVLSDENYKKFKTRVGQLWQELNSKTQ